MSRLTTELAEMAEKLKESEKQRRILHNRIQELRGNVRVMVTRRASHGREVIMFEQVRCRPFIPYDGVDLSEGADPPKAVCTFSANEDSGVVSHILWCCKSHKSEMDGVK